MNTRKKGEKSEHLAISFLESKGMEVLGRNFNCSFGEIDVVCQHGEELVFVEVKSTTNNSLISIWETVSKSKARKLAKAIDFWLQQKGKLNSPWRFDFVGIVYNDKDYSVEHIANAEL